MLIQAHSLSPSSIALTHRYCRNPIWSGCDSFSLFSKWPFNVRDKRLYRRVHSKMFSSASEKWTYGVLRLNGAMNMCFWRRKNSGVVFSASEGLNSGSEMQRKRKIVEHTCLFKTKEELSDEEEKDMLDYLYTTQYQMGGVVAMSLGRISHQNVENYTYAVYMRFQRKEDLLKFYENPFYLQVLKEHVMPYCHGLINVDFESEVEDDILPIFRKGEEFNYGVEFILLIAFTESASGRSVEDALASLAKLAVEFPSLIVQSTQGSNFNPSNKEYTHGVVIRFRSLEAFEIFVGGSEYKDMWRSKFQLITKKTLSVHFSVDPVGTEIM